MRVIHTRVRVPISEARQTGKWERRVYWVLNGRDKYGPFARAGDANILCHKLHKQMKGVR